jgi:Rod binding domain-containing protein
LLSGAKAAATGSSSSAQDAKIEKAGKDFESILLGSWLQKAEESFATVPGGNGDDDDDSSKDQFQGMAMQSLAGSLTASGGIGIAKMITASLRASSHGKNDSESASKAAGTVSPSAVKR